jgi:thiol peroxidase
MTQITFKGNTVNTSGPLPAVGAKLPPFRLVGTDLGEISLDGFSKKSLVLNVFPSIDTPTCAMSVRTFNQKASAAKGAVVFCISMDLPFAAARFCGAEGLSGVVPASAFRSPEFGKDYGLTMVDGPLKGLLARAVIVANADGEIVHVQLVSEIAQEPDYASALNAL